MEVHVEDRTSGWLGYFKSKYVDSFMKILNKSLGTCRRPTMMGLVGNLMCLAVIALCRALKCRDIAMVIRVNQFIVDFCKAISYPYCAVDAGKGIITSHVAPSSKQTGHKEGISAGKTAKKSSDNDMKKTIMESSAAEPIKDGNTADAEQIEDGNTTDAEQIKDAKSLEVIKVDGWQYFIECTFSGGQSHLLQKSQLALLGMDILNAEPSLITMETCRVMMKRANSRWQFQLELTGGSVTSNADESDEFPTVERLRKTGKSRKPAVPLTMNENIMSYVNEGLSDVEMQLVVDLYDAGIHVLLRSRRGRRREIIGNPSKRRPRQNLVEAVMLTKSPTLVIDDVRIFSLKERYNIYN
jgi:hypothetical protein